LDLHHFYYSRKDAPQALPKELALKILTAEPFFQKAGEADNPVQLEDYHWSEVGKAFVKRYPYDSLQLADKMLKHFGEDGTVLEGFRSQAFEVLDEIIRRFPADVWKRLVPYLGPPMDGRAFEITYWLQGGCSARAAVEAGCPLFHWARYRHG
jgi:hypothetical protein